MHTPPWLPTSRRTLLAYALLAAAALLALVGLARAVPALLRGPSQIDFAAYYVAGRQLNAGVGLYRPSPLGDAAVGIADIPHTGYIYPPLLAALLRPLAALPYRQAETAWFLLNVLLYAAMCAALCRALAPGRRWVMLALPLGLLLPAVYDTWLLGQVSMLLALLVAASLALALHERPSRWGDLLAGAMLGLAVAIKVYPAVLAGVYLIHRRWWALLGIAASVALYALVGVALGGGWENTAYWIASVLPNAASMAPFPSNQSLRGVVERFFTANTFHVAVLSAGNDVQVRLAPTIDSPALGALLTLGGSAAALGATAWAMLRRPAALGRGSLALDMALGTAVMLLVTPVVWDFYFVHLLLPLLLLASAYWPRPNVALATASACLLLALHRYWRYALLYAQSPWLMAFGFLAVAVVWATLLRLRWQAAPA